LFFVSNITAQQIQILSEGTKTSIRGLSVVNDNVFWASGSSGMVARSTDGGKTIQWQQVKGYEKRDFRDIEAFDSNTAIIMGVDWPAIILKTKDGGKNWYKVFEDSTKGMFLDAMVFDDNYSKFGVVVGDPIGSTFFNAITGDYGETWKTYPDKGKVLPDAEEGEAFFASSGTNFAFLGNHPAFVSGGKHSRLLFAGRGVTIPIIQGKESTGANSFAVDKSLKRGLWLVAIFQKIQLLKIIVF